MITNININAVKNEECKQNNIKNNIKKNINKNINNRTDAKLKQRTELILSFFNEHKRMPSYSEMAILFGLKSKNAVFKIVNKLQKEGIIIKDDKRRTIFNSNFYSSQAFSPTPDSDSGTAPSLPSSYFSPYGFSIKLLGRVEAGFPSPAEEELLDMISIDKLLIKNPVSSFLLKVTGDSMTEAGIMQGDYVIVDKSLTASEGDIVIAQVDNAWTMKYLSKENGSYILLPANPRYKPIKPKNELQIAGVVTGVARKYK
ncbi:MAG: transcriptional repressor LexA [bacterium]